ncbi:phage regulatory CII family protein [Desulfovibrio sp. Huiquan2017]|uniref:phage regulatory CII family protein n=1 Tax=Desulfovibrio sp. Huiquan2017 TaxID=2816861 RepID=UPI001A9323EE|nr:phage regulatory CII family protein [Desulfovibrio sp. Huiquan2017]
MFEKDLTKKMQDIVLEGHIPAKEVSKLIKKPYSTLLRELNPFDAHAKLGVETMFEIVKATHNISVLEFMARELGYTLRPLDAIQPARQGTSSRRVHKQEATM